MRKRIFIAINLPENTKEELAGYREKWPELPARWTGVKNIHITLVFLGYVDNGDVSEVERIAKEVALKHDAFSINLNKVVYGPPKIVPPRMVWAIGERSQEFSSLQNDLQKSLADLPKIKFIPEKRESILHLTLARIKEWEWRRIEPEERSQIEEDINLIFDVKSVEVMESVLKRGGPEYSIIASASLANSQKQ